MVLGVSCRAFGALFKVVTVGDGMMLESAAPLRLESRRK